MRSKYLTICFEGLNGCGKSTMLDRIKEFIWNNHKDISVYNFRFPGGGISKIRDMFKDISSKFTGVTDALLSFADMREFVIKRLNDSMCVEGKCIFLLDRFYFSSFAYQKVFGNVDFEFMSYLKETCLNNVQIDLTLFLDVDYFVSVERRNIVGTLDRFEEKMENSFSLVRDEYLKFKNERFKIIDANREILEVQNDCQKYVEELIKNEEFA